ncbi:hypothetical protein F0L74_18635 [Chitinophaga agrisoli]|uniref:Lipoprotein n=2 Tax=Chitinophaga agrisoli TaxID=2607653 RepID=A0A5B2VV05_9BACT|nr:hypothetical protein F0L74_18635 [Chitinophaga agrisoli]
MKNTLKIGFLALAFGLFVAACGSGAGTGETTDSAATTATEAIDSAANVADSTVGAVADSAKQAVDSIAADTTKH